MEGNLTLERVRFGLDPRLIGRLRVYVERWRRFIKLASESSLHQQFVEWGLHFLETGTLPMEAYALKGLIGGQRGSLGAAPAEIFELSPETRVLNTPLPTTGSTGAPASATPELENAGKAAKVRATTGIRRPRRVRCEGVSAGAVCATTLRPTAGFLESGMTLPAAALRPSTGQRDRWVDTTTWLSSFASRRSLGPLCLSQGW